MSMSPDDRKRVATAIHAAESRTSGEIVCVLAQCSTDGRALPVLIAAIVALALPWVLVTTTAMPVLRILTLQVAVFIVIAAALHILHLCVDLIPRAARRALAHRAALVQFSIRGVAQTKNRTGILIFVSLAEHYARIVADEGIAARVHQSEWQSAIDALVAHMRDGRIADGYIAAIDVCGTVLARDFPASRPAQDELPDRIYLI
jgi:putative membrane protein